MLKDIAFIIYYNKSNKNSFNILIGALETDNIIEKIDIIFVSKQNEFNTHLDYALKNYNKIVIGISFFTTQLFEINNLIKTIKKKKDKNKIIYLAGGPHPTGDPLGTLKIGFDIAFIGEAEESIIEFFNKLNDDDDYYQIKGIAYLNTDGDIKFTGKRKPIDISKYPPFPKIYNKLGAIEITRGCPYVCYFCQTPYIMGGRIRNRSIESICKYVKIMKEMERMDIRFISPNAFSYGSIDGKKPNISKLEELLVSINQIISPKGRIFLGSFPSEVRPEHVNIETLTLVKKYCANDNITIGAQSGSQSILDLCHRGHTTEDVFKAVELTEKFNLSANIDFIFGLPDETEEDINLTIKMMEELSKRKGVKIHTHSFIPLPQTPFAKKPVVKISPAIQNSIEKLTSKGLAFGEWKKQERFSSKIAKYLKTGEIR